MHMPFKLSDRQSRNFWESRIACSKYALMMCVCAVDAEGCVCSISTLRGLA